MIIASILTVALFLSILENSYGLNDPDVMDAVGSFIFAAISFLIFLSLQKKVHKDAFLEIKIKVEQQNEFKTIFNELDESLLVLNSESKIAQINRMFDQFVFRHFGE